MRKKWSLKDCKLDALRFDSRTNWRKSSYGYRVALKNGWLEECCKHMPILWKKKWTLEKCLESSKKYKTPSEWEQKDPNAYSAAQRLKCLDACTMHMTKKLNYWDLEKCKADALRFKTRSEWQLKSPGYAAALKRGWLKECCKHMGPSKTAYKWDKDSCKKEALKFKTRKEWATNSSSSYQKARSKKWLDECCSHMKKYAAPIKKWTLERLKEDALKYKNRQEWLTKSPGAYDAAYKRGLLDECCRHMEILGGTSRLEKNMQQEISKISKNLSIIYNKKFSLTEEHKSLLNLNHVSRYELDVYIPSIAVGLEFNGKYWHSFEGLKRGRKNWTEEQISRYHEDKKKYFNFIGIKIFTIEEKDWKKDKNKILSNIREVLYEKQMDQDA